MRGIKAMSIKNKFSKIDKNLRDLLSKETDDFFIEIAGDDLVYNGEIVSNKNLVYEGIRKIKNQRWAMYLRDRDTGNQVIVDNGNLMLRGRILVLWN